MARCAIYAWYVPIWNIKFNFRTGRFDLRLGEETFLWVSWTIERHRGDLEEKDEGSSDQSAIFLLEDWFQVLVLLHSTSLSRS